jgi:hypothetical protein
MAEIGKILEILAFEYDFGRTMRMRIATMTDFVLIKELIQL